MKVFLSLLSLSLVFLNAAQAQDVTYIKKEHIREVKVYRSDSVSEKYLDKHQYYDTKGNLIRDIHFHKDSGRIDSFVSVYTYDSLNRILSYTEMDKSSVLIQSETYTYDGNACTRVQTDYDDPENKVLCKGVRKEHKGYEIAYLEGEKFSRHKWKEGRGKSIDIWVHYNPRSKSKSVYKEGDGYFSEKTSDGFYTKGILYYDSSHRVIKKISTIKKQSKYGTFESSTVADMSYSQDGSLLSHCIDGPFAHCLYYEYVK